MGLSLTLRRDDAHERSWFGTHLKQRVWVWLKKPVPMKGIQGFRYVSDQDLLGGTSIRKQLNDAEKDGRDHVNTPWDCLKSSLAPRGRTGTRP